MVVSLWEGKTYRIGLINSGAMKSGGKVVFLKGKISTLDYI